MTDTVPRWGGAGRGDLTAELSRALEHDEFRLSYQPTVDLRDGAVVGCEALLRWRHPRWGELDPHDFLAQAERSSLVVPLGCWVIERAVEQAARWRRDLGRPVRVWVNLGAAQLDAVTVISATLVRALERFDAQPDLIGFEVTESTLMRSIDDAVIAVRSLRELGFDIALDDFGTGYSSLAYLRRLPVTTVKIDRSFVSGMGGSLADAAIVEAVVDLAHALGHGVLAEGVEERRQAEDLLALGADRAQGFYFAPPLPAEEIEPLLDLPWCGAKGPEGAAGELTELERRADRLPGAGGPRARLLLTALDSVSDAVVVFVAAPDPRRNTIVYVNPAFEAQTGMRSSEVVGHVATVLDPPGPEHPEVAELLAATTTVRPVTGELPARRADGSSYPCEVTLSPIVDDKGIVTHWLALRRDLTARRALEAERSRFQRVIERGSSGALITDVHGAISYANAAACELVGMDRDALVDTSITDLFDPALGTTGLGSVRTSVARQGSWIGTGRLANRRTGELVPVELEVQLVVERPPSTEPAYLATLLHDRRPELRRQDLRELAGRFAARVLERPPRQSLLELRTLVRQVGTRLGADLCFVDLIDGRRGLLVTEAVWQAGAVRDERSEVPLERLATWLGTLAHSDPLVLDGTEVAPVPGHDERMAVFGAGPQLAQITVPLRVDGQLLGVLGVAMPAGQQRSWSDDEQELLRSLGETAANLIARHGVEEGEARRASYDSVAYTVAQRALDLGPGEFLAALPSMLADLGRVLACDHVVAGRLAGARFVEVASWGDPGPERGAGVGAASNDRLPAAWPELAELAIGAGATGAAPVVVPSGRHHDDHGSPGAGAERGASKGHRDAEAGAGDTGDTGDAGDAGSMVVVPLVVAGRSIGVLTAIARQRRRWADDEVALVRTVGETLAYALERRRVDEALARSEARLTALLSNTADIVVVVDRSGVVRYVSQALSELLGVEPLNVVARHFSEFVHEDDHSLATAGLMRAEGNSQTERVRISLPDGGYRWFEARSNDRFDEAVGGLVVVLRDIQERVVAEEEAAYRAGLEQFVLHVARVDRELGSAGFLDRLGTLLTEYGEVLGTQCAYVDVLDEDAGMVVNLGGWCEGTDADGGFAPLELSEVEAWIARLSELRPVAIDGRPSGEADGAGDGQGRTTDPRLPGGGASLAMPLAAEGRLIGVLGVGMTDAARVWTSDEINITLLVADVVANAIRRARVDEALRASEMRFRLLAEQAADVVTLAGPDGELRYLSPSIRELLGYEPDELLGAQLIEHTHPDDQHLLQAAHDELVEGQLFTHEIRLARSDGTWVWVANSGRAVRDATSRLVEVRGSLRDVSERKRLEAELAERATHDPLTGLGNRALLAERLARSTQLDGLCLLLIDLDGFKAVNDRHGHNVGDSTLQVIATRLRTVTRPGDLVARYGGDEFIVVSERINEAAAVALGDRIVSSLSLPILIEDLVVRLGASVGVAVADGTGIPASRLLRAADSAMYRAKREGKGTVRVAAVRP